jgi:hypothetical protein
MVQITFETHGHGLGATTTIDLPGWAPPIFDASTGTNSDLICFSATTSAGALDTDDIVQSLPIDLKSFDATKIRPADNTASIPIVVTLKYLTENELLRT